PTPGELRDLLRVSVPDYMIPAVFVELAAFPLTASGKVDRAALPAVDQVRPDPVPGSVAPRTVAEELLAAIWSEVLGVDQVGVLDDFFELGGHSLLATQVTSRARAVFGVELPVAALFDSRTVAGLAEVVDRTAAGVPAPPITPVDRDRQLPLSFGQQRLWLLSPF